jgi:hypothetical protein
MDKLNNINSVYQLYDDFNWENYKNLNPYLYIIGLRKEEEYIYNYLMEGRYIGRKYKINDRNNNSFHVLLATIGKDTIFNILNMLKIQLTELDYLTIVFDGINKSKNIIKVKQFTSEFRCNVKIIIEEENLGYWGHGIRNKHNNLEGDFIYHIDDDDIIFDNTFKIIRNICQDKNTIYLFKIKLKNNTIIWKTRNIKLNEISTQSGVIPTQINKEGYWELKYGGDYSFYKKLSEKYRVLFIDKLIYKKN